MITVICNAKGTATGVIFRSVTLNSPISMVLFSCCRLPVLAVVGETVTVVEAVVVDSVLSSEQTNV